MELKEKITFLEEHNLNWLEIADILDLSYERVRNISEGGEDDD